MIPTPPRWRPSRRGDGLRRRLGPAELSLYRRDGRGGYFCSVTLRLDARGPAEAAALAEAVAGAFLQAHAVRVQSEPVMATEWRAPA